ncbi:MAG: phosphoglucosamine mutase [Saprospiraceae bacterium]|nr:phosphoglucosamine mutase [Saprospiraceae bacterium]
MSLIVSVSGIRGTIGGLPSTNLTPTDILKYSVAYGLWLKTKNSNPTVVIGRDSRISGEMVSNLVIGSLQSLGIHIINCGLSTTPTIEMEVVRQKADGGIILTASHNPIHWNALKLLNHLGEFISEEDGKKIIEFSNNSQIHFSDALNLGKISFVSDAIEKHIESILNLKIIPTQKIRSKKFHIIADCINSTGAMALPLLFDSLNCSYELINNKINGQFAHNPEPLESNLSELINNVKNRSAALGIAVDPDVDRLVLVDENGLFFGEEYTLVCTAEYMLNLKPGNTVSNLSSSRALRDLTISKGGRYFASAVGEVHVVHKMKEVNAIYGGEGNGGTILPDLHYGRDALVGIVLTLANLVTQDKSLSQLKANYPKYEMSKDKIELNPDLDYSELINYVKSHYSHGQLNTIDGLKIDLNEGWIHLRKSNTEPIIRIYSESDTEKNAKNLSNKLKELILKFK